MASRRKSNGASDQRDKKPKLMDIQAALQGKGPATKLFRDWLLESEFFFDMVIFFSIVNVMLVGLTFFRGKTCWSHPRHSATT